MTPLFVTICTFGEFLHIKKHRNILWKDKIKMLKLVILGSIISNDCYIFILKIVFHKKILKKDISKKSTNKYMKK